MPCDRGSIQAERRGSTSPRISGRSQRAPSPSRSRSPAQTSSPTRTPRSAREIEMNKNLKAVQKNDGQFGSVAAMAALEQKINKLITSRAGSSEREAVQADISHLLRGLKKL